MNEVVYLSVLAASGEVGVVRTLRRYQGVCQVGSNYLLLFQLFPVRSDNDPTVQFGHPSRLGGCGSGQSRSPDLCQGPLEVIEM